MIKHWNIRDDVKMTSYVTLEFTSEKGFYAICIDKDYENWSVFENEDEIIDYLAKEYLYDRMPLEYTTDDLYMIASAICNEIVSSWTSIPWKESID